MPIALGLGAVLLGVCSVSTASAAASYEQQKADKPLIVVELFTSQGCSSCPPADRLQNKLIAEHPEVLSLTFPVDYWDYLGWADTLAKPANAQRQVDYRGRSLSGRVFTPQMIIDGTLSAVGSRRNDVLKKIKQRQNQSSNNVPLSLSIIDGKVIIETPAQPGALSIADSGKATLWLFPFHDFDDVHVAGGENRGHSVRYTHVVQSHIALGQWTGEAATFEFTLPEEMCDLFGYAVILQADRIGPIIGAAWMRDTAATGLSEIEVDTSMTADPMHTDLPY